MPEIALVSSSNQIVFLAPSESGEWTTSGDAAEGLWPVSRPGADWTASVVEESSRLQHRDRTGSLEVPGSSNTPPALIGPRLAHYAAWSPDGERLCYVVPDGRALSLRTWRPGEVGFHTHLSAAPVFPAWVPGTDWLLCHHGATLSAFETATGEQRILSASASGFRTPPTSSDGSRIAWAEVSTGSVVVFSGSMSGEPAIVGRFNGGVALSYRPQSYELVAAVASSPESGVFGEIVKIAGDGANPVRLVQGPLVAYWWSPDGEKLATLHPTYSGDGRFQVRLHDANGDFLGAMEALIPSADTATMVGFFDQYAVSHPRWSEDSRWFALCGRIVSEGPHPSFSGGNPDSAFVWDTQSRGAPARFGDAALAVFGRGQVNGG